MIAPIALTLLAAWTCDQEDARVRAHLEDAYAQLVTSPPPLTAEQGEARRDVIAALRRYIDRGRFPRNHSSEPATPVFVDESGTHCAMGALIAELGGEAVVENIRRTRNLARVPELADEPGLLEWLDAHGVAPEEAALVQPTYYACQPVWEIRSTPSIYEAVVVPSDAGLGVGIVATASVAGDRVCQQPYFDQVTSRLPWPIGTVVTLPDFMAKDSAGWTTPQFRNCAWRPTLADGDRAQLLNLFQMEPHLALFRRDPRWFIPQCHSNFGGPNLDFCTAEGRFRPEVLPARGTMRARVLAAFQHVAWVSGSPMATEESLADAGVNLALIDAIEAQVWELATDGGTPLDAGVPPVAQWVGPLLPIPCDAGSAPQDAGVPDAGFADAGFADAGLADAGVPPPADGGSPDAGVPSDEEPRGGCGCNSAPLGLALVALVQALRRRVRAPAGPLRA